MGRLILRILSAIAAAVPYLLDWWQRRQEQKRLLARAARRALVDADPDGEFLRKFNPDAKLPNAAAPTPDPEQPNCDPTGRDQP